MSHRNDHRHQNHCGCTGRDGRLKKLYKSEGEAAENADYALRKRGVRLRVYSCPCDAGYHLTSDIVGETCDWGW